MSEDLENFKNVNKIQKNSDKFRKLFYSLGRCFGTSQSNLKPK